MNRKLIMRRRPGHPFGAYKGYFRIDYDSANFVYHRAWNLLTGHPSDSKLFAASGDSATNSALYEIHLPDLEGLETDPANVSTSDLATTANTDTAIIDSWKTVLPGPAHARFGGLTYRPDAGDLWVSMARYYHVDAAVYDHLGELSTDGNFTLQGSWRGSQPQYTGSTFHPSDPMGRLSHTEGSSLTHDFIGTPSWKIDTHGPRLVGLTPSPSVADEYTWDQIAVHSQSNQEADVSFWYGSGAGFFHNGKYYFAVRRGLGEGWYGHPDGYSTPDSETGTLGTRTSDSAGVITGVSGHNFTASETPVKIRWTSPSTGEQTGGSVDAITADTITFSGATGDALPAASSTVTIDHWGAGDNNLTPDETDTGTGYHDPPYAAALYSCAESDLQDAIDGTIDPHEIPWTIDKNLLADRQMATEEGQERGDIQVIAKHAGYVFAYENDVDDAQNVFERLGVVHVWEQAS